MPFLRVKVTAHGGPPVADARVFIETGPEPFPDIAALSDDRGEVVMNLGAPGRYGIVCAADGFKEARTSVDVVEGVGEAVAVVELSPQD